MKYLLLILCMFVHAISLTAGEFWEKKQAVPSDVIDSHGFSVNGKVYIVCGMKAFGELMGYDIIRETWEYDPATDQWTQKADFPGNKCLYGLAFALNGRGYLTTGVQTLGHPSNSPLVPTDSNALWEYDPLADTWTRKGDFPGLARMKAFAFTMNGKAYIGGGHVINELSFLKDFWEYVPANNTWTQKANIPANMVQSTTFSDDRFGYAGLGGGTNFWRYDPTADKWSAIAPFPHLYITGSAGCFFNGKRYVIGGNQGFTSYPPFIGAYEYDPEANQWNTVAPVRTDCETSGFAVVIDGELYYYGYGGLGSKQSDPVKGWIYHLSLTATDVQETVQADAVQVSPTLFDDMLHVRSAGGIREVSMYNMLGDRVQSVQVGGSSCELSGAHLVRGIYFVKVLTADGRVATVTTFRR